jgi:hypothetical protein
MAGKGWDKQFEMPIDLADRRELVTLRDAIKCLVETVPVKERNMPQVTTAADLLTRASEGSDAWVLLARMGTMQALHRHAVRVFNPDRNGGSGS